MVTETHLVYSQRNGPRRAGLDRVIRSAQVGLLWTLACQWNWELEKLAVWWMNGGVPRKRNQNDRPNTRRCEQEIPTITLSYHNENSTAYDRAFDRGQTTDIAERGKD